MKRDYDFCGWATKNDLKCSDGRVIRRDAFKHNDGARVPLVWNHQHDDVNNILGHADLENREKGVYAYCKFNETENGLYAKEAVRHGDISSLSILANQLKQVGESVMHGQIREVSLVLAGANPGAVIDVAMMHGEQGEESEAIIYSGEDLVLEHSDKGESEPETKDTEEKEMANTEGKTVGDIFNTLTEEQKNVVYLLVGQAMDEDDTEDEGDDDGMKHNIFDTDDQDSSNTLSHSDMLAVIKDGQRKGSLKEGFIAHGIEDIEFLFPDAKNVTNAPTFISRDMGWVKTVMNHVHHTPFSRIKSIHANITEEEARALGYIKGKLKKDEVFTLLKRTTAPSTIYKKQKIERDDMIDITDFDVVAWIKAEMRMMLEEEIARAILVGDGRITSSDDKIPEDTIRPIWTDSDLYTIKATVTTAANASNDDVIKQFIRTCVKARKEYKGSGSPTLYTTEDVLTDCLLLEDTLGHRLYDTTEKLATSLRVSNIVTVPVMENLKRERTGGVNADLMGIIINFDDYNVGADKGGAITMFDDFDIDYNAQKYLIETHISGALVRPYSAIAVEHVVEA